MGIGAAFVRGVLEPFGVLWSLAFLPWGWLLGFLQCFVVETGRSWWVSAKGFEEGMERSRPDVQSSALCCEWSFDVWLAYGEVPL